MKLLMTFVVLTLAANAQARVAISSQGTEFLGIKTSSNVEAFLGIPFAQAPVGNLRWKAPRDIELPAVFSAKKLGSICAQLGNMFSGVSTSLYGKPIGSEDCLYLNIWKPRVITGAPKPVFFWIHGGSNSKGTANDPNYDGSYFAETNDAIYVSVNYRLGLFGAFAHDALGTGNRADDSGNYVTLDLIQALKWVQTNISQFGGDPHRVIIAGQSAGCINIWGLLQSPLAKDLFHGAICSAGIPNSYPKIVVEERAKSLLIDLFVKDKRGSNDSEAREHLKKQNLLFIKKYLLSKTTEELLSIPRSIMPTQHISDGYVIPSAGLSGITLGQYNKVPLILGSTSNEGTYLFGVPMLKTSEAELYTMINNTGVKYNRKDFIDEDFLSSFESITSAGSKSLLLTLNSLAQMLRLYQNNIYVYKFAWHQSPEPWNDIFKSFHGLDAVFYIGNFVDNAPSFTRFAWTKENKESREQLRDHMSHYFKAFLHHGNPNYGNSLARWPDYSKNSDQIIFK